jgi:hypothetical protein
VYKRTDDRIGKELVRECMIQTHLNHKNILGCLGYEKTATDFRLFFEYMGLGSFWDVLYRRKVALKYALHAPRSPAHTHAHLVCDIAT